MARRRRLLVSASIDAPVRERRALEARERTLIAKLNATLKRMGLAITPGHSGTGPEGLKRRDAAARRRKPMSATARKAVSRRMKAYWAKRKEPRRRRGSE